MPHVDLSNLSRMISIINIVFVVVALLLDSNNTYLSVETLVFLNWSLSFLEPRVVVVSPILQHNITTILALYNQKSRFKSRSNITERGGEVRCIHFL